MNTRYRIVSLLVLGFQVYCGICLPANSTRLDSSEEVYLKKRVVYPTSSIDGNELRCFNNGKQENGRCTCIHPYTGPYCQDFACFKGLSVGPRYDPNNLFFNKMCICEDDWDGELCDIPTADQCNERGKFTNGACICNGFFFGPECQYVRKCDEGKLSHGRCLCNKGWEGDYCNEIVCQHGHPDTANGSQVCVCPTRYKGLHCNTCSQTGKHVTPYPECTVEIVPHSATIYRQKNDKQILHRFFAIFAACIFLSILSVTMYMLNLYQKMYGKPPSPGVKLYVRHSNNIELLSCSNRDQSDSLQETNSSLYNDIA
uniref:EGF-like domain-containing protein n=1 Tax=Rhabditophanes sp. KR3021 TaxID=114890 RepID=A0AC35TLL8_9BILA